MCSYRLHQQLFSIGKVKNLQSLAQFLIHFLKLRMANLNSSIERYLICCAIVILVANSAVSFGRFLSAVSPSINVALGLSGPVLVPLMIFSGVFLNNDSVPSYFIWLKVSFFT